RICIIYGLTSSAISLLFKVLLSSYKYEAKFFMLAMQLVLSLAFCAIARRWLQHVPGLEVPALDATILKRCVNYSNAAAARVSSHSCCVCPFLACDLELAHVHRQPPPASTHITAAAPSSPASCLCATWSLGGTACSWWTCRRFWQSGAPTRRSRW